MPIGYDPEGARIITGTAAALNADAISTTDISFSDSISVQITGTWSGTLTFQGCNDNASWVNVNAQTASDDSTGTVQTSIANGLFFVPSLFAYFRVRMTSYTSGTATVTALISSISSQDLAKRKVAASQDGNWSVRITDGTDQANVSSTNDLQVRDSINTASVNGAISVTTAASEAKVGASRLVNRKFLSVLATDGTIYYGSTSGVTTVNGTPIFKNQLIVFSFTDNVPVYLIASGTRNVRIMEGS